MKKKATAVVMIGSSGENQVIMMPIKGKFVSKMITDEHSFLMAEVVDDDDKLTITIRKKTIRSATQHKKLFCPNKVFDLNCLRWDELLLEEIWGFTEK